MESGRVAGVRKHGVNCWNTGSGSMEENVLYCRSVNGLGGAEQ